MPTATADKRGLKRICLSCSTRFYDFNKRPIICPNCDTEFTGDVKVRTRRARVANDEYEGPIGKAQADDTEMESIKDVDDDELEEDTVSLEEVEEDDGDDLTEDDEVDPDLDIDGDDADADFDDDDDSDDDDDDDLDEDEDEDE